MLVYNVNWTVNVVEVINVEELGLITLDKGFLIKENALFSKFYEVSEKASFSFCNFCWNDWVSGRQHGFNVETSMIKAN